MSHRLTLTVRADVDGVEFPGFPLSRTLDVDQVPHGFLTHRTGDGVFRSLPILALRAVRCLAVAPVGPGNAIVRLAAQSDRGVTVQPRGLFLVFNGHLTVPRRSLNATLSSAAPTLIAGLAGGT